MLVPSSSMRDSLELRCLAYEGQLKGSPAVPYLESRGITTEAAASFRVGYTAEPLPGDEDFVHRLVIPYLTPSGVVQLRFRTLSDAEPKYLSEHGAVSRPFNTRVLVGDTQTVYVTEGEIDAITATLCDLPAVGFDGATKWKPSYWRIFRYRQVVVLADGDKAGGEFGRSVAKTIHGCKIIKMPPGEDVNSFFCREGEEALRRKAGADRD